MKFPSISNISNFFSTKKLALLLSLLLISFTTSIIILSSVPPVDRDSLTHHLFIPKLYLNHGGIYEIPEIIFSYYPMNLDLLYMIPLSFGNDIAPKFIHFFFALLSAGLVYKYLRSRTSRNYALLGSLFLLTIPIILKLSITAYVDLGLMFFSAASLLLIFRWVNCDFQLRYLLLAGICCGLAAGVKYNGIVSLVILVLMIPLLYLRTKKHTSASERKSLIYSFIFLFIALAAFSPWMARNYLWTGNPIYPLHDSIFNSASDQNFAAPSENAIDQDTPKLADNPFVSRKILYKETWWQTLLLPLRFFFEGQDDNPQFFDGKLNPFLLFLPIFAFARKSTSSQILIEKQTLLAFALLFFFFTFFQQVTRIRYVICIIPPLVILSIFGLQNLFNSVSLLHSFLLRRICTICVFFVPVAFLGYNLDYLIQQYSIVQPWSYISGKITRDQYISHFRPEFPAIQFVNTLQQQTKILAIFLGNRGYYFDKPVQFDLKASRSMLLSLAKIEKNENQISESLKTQNISHLLIRYDLFKDSIRQQLKPEEFKRLDLFFQNQTKLVYNAYGHGVFQLL